MDIAHTSLSIHNEGSAPLQREQDLLQTVAVVHLPVNISENRKGYLKFYGEVFRLFSTPAANDQNRRVT